MDESIIYLEIRMSPELEKQPAPVIEKVKISDIESYRRMQAASWLDTYPNEEAGVSYQWVKDRTDKWFTPEALEDSKVRVQKILDDSEHQFLYVAKVGDISVGVVHTTAIDGNQRLEALYVDKEYRGTGVAQDLVDEALNHLDLSKPIALEVISYNERAQRFYQKNGFDIKTGSEHLYAGVMPSIVMIRPGDKL
jgi:ribosomal protein S18 acetylase RimI-like enzyme